MAASYFFEGKIGEKRVFVEILKQSDMAPLRSGLGKRAAAPNVSEDNVLQQTEDSEELCAGTVDEADSDEGEGEQTEGTGEEASSDSDDTEDSEELCAGTVDEADSDEEEGEQTEGTGEEASSDSDDGVASELGPSGENELQELTQEEEVSGFRCIFCDFTTLLRGQLDKHIVQHTNDDQFKFSLKTKVVSHQLFECDKCDKELVVRISQILK